MLGVIPLTLWDQIRDFVNEHILSDEAKVLSLSLSLSHLPRSRLRLLLLLWPRRSIDAAWWRMCRALSSLQPWYVALLFCAVLLQFRAVERAVWWAFSAEPLASGAALSLFLVCASLIGILLLKNALLHTVLSRLTDSDRHRHDPRLHGRAHLLAPSL